MGCVCVAVKFLQRTRDGESNETATTQMEQHLGEIIAYVEDVIVSCLHYRYVRINAECFCHVNVLKCEFQCLNLLMPYAY